MSERYFIRFGDIPENEESGIYRSGERIGTEVGVSVYDAVEVNGDWRILLPAQLKVEIGFDLYSFISRANNAPGYELLPMYLVAGDVVGYGSTNEPLLKNIKIIKQLN